MKKKLLLLTPELPYPLQSGGKVKTWNMLAAFAEHWDITLVCPLKESDGEFVDEFAEKAPIEKLVTDSVRVPRTAKNLLKSYLQFKPLNLVRTFSKTLKSQVAEMVNDFDLVLVDHYEVFQFLPESLFKSEKRPLVVYHAHNAYHQIWQRYSKTTESKLEKIVCSIEATRVCRYESKVCKLSDLVFAAPNDIATLQNICSTDVVFRDTLHLGDDANLKKPELRVKETKNKLCYAGFLGWEPNVQGLLWFLDRVWPALKSSFPDLSLDIAGKNPDQRLIDAVECLDGVELLGFVEDLEDLYQESRISICPLLFGSGIKVKVANSLARGIPVITTRVGVEGLELVHGVHLMVADDAEATIQAAVALLSNDSLWTRISLCSRELMRSKYTWDALFERMFHDIEEAEAKHVGKSSSSLAKKIKTKFTEANIRVA